MEEKIWKRSKAREGGNGFHLVHFLEFWDYSIGESVLQVFVIALLATYICLFHVCCKGREIYATFR